MKSEVIPKGIYCYDKNGVCPYFTYISISDVKIPYCLFLKKGSASINLNDSDIEKLKTSLDQTEEELYNDILSLDLLWDQCKECGENMDDQTNIEYIYKKAIQIYESDLDWDKKYDKVFSEEIGKKVYHLFDWYDPDTSYEEDVTAFINAFKNYILNEYQ